MKQETKFKDTEIGLIPEEWDVKELKEVSIDVSYGYTASAKTEKVGPKFLRITDIVPYFVNWDDVPYCKIEEKDYRKYKLQQGDLVIARTGATTGYNAIIKKEENVIFASYLIRFRLNKNLADPFFIGFILKSNLWKGFVDGIIGGSAQPGANAKQFGQFRLPMPSLPEQKSIAKILSDLDSKIELLQKQNKTLEAIGQALFKHWFVDFEFPNEEGKPYKSSGGETVFNEELGKEIPKGWVVKPLDQIANFLNGLALQKFPPEDDEFLPVIKIKELRQGITEQSDKASPDIDKKYIINDGDILFSWSGSLMVVIWGEGKGALNQHLFKVTSDDFEKWFYYYWIKNHLRKFIGIAKDKTTTMGHIKRHHLTVSKVLVPNDVILGRMNEIMKSFTRKIIKNKLELRRLINLRDTLLPKLMSGEIRVNNLEAGAE